MNAMATSFAKSGIFPNSETQKQEESLPSVDSSRQIGYHDAGIYDDGIIQQIVLNKDVDVDDYHIDISVPLNSEKFKRELASKNSKLEFLVEGLRNTAERRAESETLTTTGPTEQKTANKNQFLYSLKDAKLSGRDFFTLFVKLSTNAFISLNDIRGRLSYAHDFMTANISTSENLSNYESDYTLSTINAWIWMSVEIFELFNSSSDVLQDPRDLKKCEDFIWEQLPVISDQIKNLRNSLTLFEKDFDEFNSRFSKAHSSIRRTFSEAISVEVEDFRTRFLQESLDRSGEMISVLSRTSPLPKRVAEERSEFIGWGIDGLSLKTKRNPLFILLRVTKTNSVQFLPALKVFFEGFSNFLKRSLWFFKGISSAFIKIAKHKDDPTDILTNLLMFSERMGYVFPMEQTRCIQAVWQIQEVLKESWELHDLIAEELQKSEKLWQEIFGKEIVRRNNFRPSMVPFKDWKLCRGLAFQLPLGTSDLPRNSGRLSLMVPYKCSSNTPLFFQVFENCFCSVVDFESEYKHRTKRLRSTGKVLEDDALICSDVIQHVYYFVNIVIENLRRMSDSLENAHKDIMELHCTDSGRKVFLGLNTWFFVCTECLLAMDAAKCDETVKQNFILEFQACFRSVNQWMTQVQILERKYKRQLKEVIKLQNMLPNINIGTSTTTISIPFEAENELADIRSRQNDMHKSENSKVGVKVNLAYDGMFIEYLGYCRNIRTLDPHSFAYTTKLFLNHTSEMLSSANNICLESLDLLNSERRVNGRKDDTNIHGIRDTIQQMQEDLKRPFNINPLEVLVGRLCLMDLHASIVDFIAILTDIFAVNKFLYQDLEYPMRVLNGLLKKRWPSPKTDIASVADYTSETLMIIVEQKPLPNELKYVLAILGGYTGETSADRFKELLYPVPITPNASKMASLIEEFGENIFGRLSSIRSSFQRKSSVSTNCQNERRTSGIKKPFFISIIPALIAISLQHTHPDWNNAPWVKESQQIFKKLKKLSKETDSYLTILQKLNTRLQEGISSLTTIVTKTSQNTITNSSDNVSDLSRMSEGDSENKGVVGDTILRLEFGEQGHYHSPGGLISVNFVGYDEWNKLCNLTANVQSNVIRDMIDVLKITLSRQSKNFHKLDDKKVFKSFKKALPTLTEKDSLNIHKLYLRLEAAKKVLSRVESALNITRSALDETLSLFEDFCTVENKSTERILSKFNTTLPTQVLVSSSNVHD